jgi:hypothetical protein
MAIRTFMRKEIKFLLTDEQYKALIPVLEEYMRPDDYCVNGGEYGIYNLYYDTEDNYLIKESLNKPYYKEKLRLRSYYSPAKPSDKVFLEIKKKIGGIVVKRRVTMTLEEANRYVETGEKPVSDKYIQNQVFAELDAFLARYKVTPKQYISYQRRAYFGKDDSTFRLTFDRNITTRRNDLRLSSESYGWQIIQPTQHLMEVKVSDSIPMWLAVQMAELGIFKTSFSKYGTGYKQYVYHQLNIKNQEEGKVISIA